MCILTAVQARKRTFHGPVYLVPDVTVIPPGDGSQKTHSVRTIPWFNTAVEVEAQACGKCDHHFYPILSDKRDWHEDTSALI